MDPKDAQAAAIIARLILVTLMTHAITSRPGPQDPPPVVVERASELADEILKRNPLPV